MRAITSAAIFFFSLVFFACSKTGEQASAANQKGKPAAKTTKQPLMIIFSGESNSGGYVSNSYATPAELAVRPAVQILNNTTLLFEDLHIGVNNLIDHYGIPDNKYHGWENELATRAAAGSFKTSLVYLVKTGQGGSVITEWNKTGTYYKKFITRVSNAVKQVYTKTGKYPLVFLFYSQGINDAIANYPVQDWKTKTRSHLQDIRNDLSAIKELGGVPVIMPHFMTGFTAYDTTLTRIAIEIKDCYLVSSEGASLKGSYHWDYNGMKVIADRMIDTLITRY